jgi:lipoate-protein ligase A
MAVDEAILNTGIPTLRLYAWSPACLSLGYGQKIADVDFERLSVELVRRPTGGRAILHADELTYSLALPAHDPIAADGVIESYRQISEALMAGLYDLGAHPSAGRRAERDTSHSPACFETPSHYEIMINGRKLIGSAQMRRKEGILQHGSLPLYGDIARICDMLTYPDDGSRERARTQMRERAETLSDALNGKVIRWETAAESLVNGFREVFEVDFVHGELTEVERVLAAQRVREKYANPEWTNRR